MEATVWFFLITSFLGSLPPGVVNTAIAFRALEKKNWTGWTLLAILAELPHVATAVWLSRHTRDLPGLFPALQWISPVLLVAMGGYYHRKKAGSFSGLSGRSFVWVNLLNPAGIPFWWAALQVHPEAMELPWLFQVPMAAIGAALAFALYAGMAASAVSLSTTSLSRLYRLTSIAFFALGLLQVKAQLHWDFF